VADTVLVVEDDTVTQSLMTEVLSVHGFEAVISRNGLDAIDLARAHNPRVILMDIRLPDVPGTEIASRLKATPDVAHISIIAVTTHVMKGEEELIRSSGCDAYVSKPIDVVKLIEIIRRLMD